MTAPQRGSRPDVEAVRTALRESMVVRVCDLITDHQGRALPLRLYRPAGPGPFSVLMFFHGGGWVTGDLDTHDGFCRHMCEWAGCAVVAVDYARAPEHPFPAAVEDCCAATQWIIDEGSGLGLDTSRMAVAGGGSGGGLAAAVSQWALARDSPRLAFQLLLYPLLDCLANNPSHHAFAKGPGLTGEMRQWYIEHYIPQGVSRADPRLSPVYAKTLGGLPPALIITCALDVLRDEGRQYARQLTKAGVLVQHKEYTDMPHGFINYPARYDPAKKALLLCAQVLQAHLQR